MSDQVDQESTVQSDAHPHGAMDCAPPFCQFIMLGNNSVAWPVAGGGCVLRASNQPHGHASRLVAIEAALRILLACRPDDASE